MPSNGTIVNVALVNLDHNFQGQAFSSYAFAIKNAQAPDVHGRFSSTRTAPATELLLLCLVQITLLTTYEHNGYMKDYFNHFPHLPPQLLFSTSLA